MYQAGDHVVYRMQKHSTKPGPRARSIAPSDQGELYTYLVDKFWVVEEVQANDQLLLRTRTGKHHTVSSGDPRLRKTRWWERLVYRNKLPQ